MKEKFYNHIVQLQETICKELEKIDGRGKFSEDKWVREEGGGGTTKILEEGELIEKGGVNISKVYGILPESMQKQLKTNDKIVTLGGIHGKITEVGKSTFVVEVHGGTKLRIEQSAVSMLGKTDLTDK